MQDKQDKTRVENTYVEGKNSEDCLNGDIIQNVGTDVNMTDEKIRKKRQATKMRQYLCDLESVKAWINSMCGTEIATMSDLVKKLKNGVLLLEIAKSDGFICKIHKNRKFEYFNIENINNFLRYLKTTDVEKEFYFEQGDLRDDKNIPRVIRCLNSLSVYLKDKEKRKDAEKIFPEENNSIVTNQENNLVEAGNDVTEENNPVEASNDVMEEKNVGIKKKTVESLVIIQELIKTVLWKNFYVSLSYKSKSISVQALRRFMIKVPSKINSSGISSKTMEFFRDNYQIQVQIEEAYRVLRLVSENIARLRNIEIESSHLNDYNNLKKLFFMLVHDYELLIDLCEVYKNFPLEVLFAEDVMGEFNFSKFMFHYRKVDEKKAFEIAFRHFMNTKKFSMLMQRCSNKEGLINHESSEFKKFIQDIQLPLYFYLFPTSGWLTALKIRGHVSEMNFPKIRLETAQDICTHFIPLIQYSEGFNMKISYGVINSILAELRRNEKILKIEMKELLRKIGKGMMRSVNDHAVEVELVQSNLLVGKEISHIPLYQGQVESMKKPMVESDNKESVMRSDDEEFVMNFDNYFIEHYDVTSLIMLQREVKIKIMKLILHSEKSDILEIVEESDDSVLMEDLRYLERKGVTSRASRYNEILEMLVYDILSRGKIELKLIGETYCNVITKNHEMRNRLKSVTEYTKCYFRSIVKNKSSFFNRSVEPESHYGTYMVSLCSMNTVCYENINPSEGRLRISSDVPLVFRLDLILLNTVLASTEISLGQLLKMNEDNVCSTVDIDNIVGVGVESLISFINSQYIDA